MYVYVCMCIHEYDLLCHASTSTKFSYIPGGGGEELHHRYLIKICVYEAYEYICYLFTTRTRKYARDASGALMAAPLAPTVEEYHPQTTAAGSCYTYIDVPLTSRTKRL